jgi:hypothetical protein
MKIKIVLLAIVALAFTLGSCSQDVYRHDQRYPPVYRTYQDRDHGGMDYGHGGGGYR